MTRRVEFEKKNYEQKLIFSNKLGKFEKFNNLLKIRKIHFQN